MTTIVNIKDEEDTENADFLTIYLGKQLFGIPILQVQDILGEQKITPVPLATKEIIGALNLRGRIVTAIDLKEKLDIKNAGEKKENAISASEKMGVVVEHEGEFYNLIIDRVGDAMRLNKKDYEATPATLAESLREYSLGVYQLKKELLVVLNISKLFENERKKGEL